MPKNPKQTSRGVASKAGKNLPKKGLSKDIKSIIASDLAQAPLKPKSKTSKKKSS